jgi:hypothetical protein
LRQQALGSSLSCQLYLLFSQIVVTLFHGILYFGKVECLDMSLSLDTCGDLPIVCSYLALLNLECPIVHTQVLIPTLCLISVLSESFVDQIIVSLALVGWIPSWNVIQWLATLGLGLIKVALCVGNTCNDIFIVKLTPTSTHK